jgi:hypothetical protein
MSAHVPSMGGVAIEIRRSLTHIVVFNHFGDYRRDDLSAIVVMKFQSRTWLDFSAMVLRARKS